MRDKDKLEIISAEFLTELGIVLESDTAQTPERFARAFLELTEGLSTEKPELKTFTTDFISGIVTIDGQCVSLCEHHFLVMSGTFRVEYMPWKKIIGVSKVPRLIKWLGKRPQIQERYTQQIVEELWKALNPVWIRATLKMFHGCCFARGAETEAEVTTEFERGKNPRETTIRDALEMMKQEIRADRK